MDSANHEGTAPVLELEAEAGKTGIWRVQLGEQVLELTSSDGVTRYGIPYELVAERVEVRKMPLGRPLLTVRLGAGAAVALPLDPTHERLVRTWLGPAAERRLGVALDRRSVWTFAIGVMILLASLPLGTTSALPVDRLYAALGVLLMGIATLMRFWPRRELFLVDSLWLAIAGLSLVYRVAVGTASAAWLLLSAVTLVATVAGFLSFKNE